MILRLKTKNKKHKFKAEVDSIEDAKEIIKSFCREYKVEECLFQLNGDASLRAISDDMLSCLFG